MPHWINNNHASYVLAAYAVAAIALIALALVSWRDYGMYKRELENFLLTDAEKRQ